MNWICKSMICTNVSRCFVEPSSVYYTENEAVGATRRHREIEEMIEKDREIVEKTMKILLLGGPESGKSTIFKQMR
jgi:polynucleotide 5'-kinase involved in rRNA processing